MKLKPAIPLFRIFDYALAKSFYCDWLGFTIDWEYRYMPDFPRYLQISRDGAVLHLTEHYGDCTPGAKVVIHLDDVEALHRELSARPNPNMRPAVEEAPWGARILQIIDPFGNRICFNQAISA
jgi:uncharacterized glyoxalase superfamily protein PhnB